jgi:hypothetical protein
MWHWAGSPLYGYGPVNTGFDGTQGYSGDNGPATRAQFFYPEGMAMDGAGNLFIADEYNNRIRVLTPPASIGAVTNAASNLAGAISPGEIVVLCGWATFPARRA